MWNLKTMNRNFGYAVLTIAYEYAQYLHHSDEMSSANDNENVDNVVVAELEETNANVSESSVIDNIEMN